MKNLSQKTSAGAVWVTSGMMAQVIVRTAVAAVLARLLAPHDFGTFASALLLLGFGELVTGFGTAASLVQIRDIEERHLGCAFGISGLLACIAFPILTGASFLSEKLLHVPDLEVSFLIISPCLFLTPVAQIAGRHLQREMIFRPSVVADIVSYFFGYGVVGTGLSYLHLGYAALAIGHAVSVATNAFMLLIQGRLRISFVFDRDIWRMLFTFGTGVALMNFFEYFAYNADRALTVTFLGTPALGLYSRASDLTARVGAIADKLSNTVLYPAFVLRKDQPDRLVAALIRSSRLLLVFLLPAAIILVVLSREMILILLGHKWMAAILPFQILALTLPFRFLRRVAAVMMVGLGSPGFNARISAVLLVCSIGFGLALYRFGLAGIATSALGALVVSTIVSMIALCGQLKMNLLEVVEAAKPGTVVAIVAGASAVGAKLACLNFGIQSPIVITFASLITVTIFTGGIILCLPAFLLGDRAHLVNPVRKALGIPAVA